jgi:hypothetical protein
MKKIISYVWREYIKLWAVGVKEISFSLFSIPKNLLARIKELGIKKIFWSIIYISFLIVCIYIIKNTLGCIIEKIIDDIITDIVDTIFTIKFKSSFFISLLFICFSLLFFMKRTRNTKKENRKECSFFYKIIDSENSNLLGYFYSSRAIQDKQGIWINDTAYTVEYITSSIKNFDKEDGDKYHLYFEAPKYYCIFVKFVYNEKEEKIDEQRNEKNKKKTSLIIKQEAKAIKYKADKGID